MYRKIIECIDYYIARLEEVIGVFGLGFWTNLVQIGVNPYSRIHRLHSTSSRNGLRGSDITIPE